MRTVVLDRATVEGIRRTGDGYLAADVRVARTGIQVYSGAEIGKPDRASVRVYRSPEVVFSADAMGSAAHKPVTIDHPSESVDARNWKKEAVGWTGETVARDGSFLRIPMMLADQTAIDAVQAGTRELSCGYSCDLDWISGTTPEGEAYDAVQRNIRINHVAIVPKGRAGPECRIGDGMAFGDAAAVRDAALGARRKHYATAYLRQDEAGRVSLDAMLGKKVFASGGTRQGAPQADSSGVSQAEPADRSTTAGVRDAAKAARDLHLRTAYLNRG